MLVELPFAYKADVTLRNGRVLRDKVFVDTVRIDVPEFFESAAQTVLRWQETPTLPVPHAGSAGVAYEVVWLDGRYYISTALQAGDLRSGGTPNGVGALVKMVDTHVVGPYAVALRDWKQGKRGHPTENIVARTRSEYLGSRKKVERIGQELIVVGDAIFRECATPKLVCGMAHQYHWTDQGAVYPSVKTYEINCRQTLRQGFSLCDFEEAPTETVHGAEIYSSFEGLEIIAPHLLAYDIDLAEKKFFVRRYLDKFMIELDYNSREDVLAIVELKAVATMRDDELSNAVFDHLLPHLETLRGLIDPLDHSARAEYDEMLARMEHAPISLAGLSHLAP